MSAFQIVPAGFCKTELAAPMFFSELWIKFLSFFGFVKIKQGFICKGSPLS